MPRPALVDSVYVYVFMTLPLLAPLPLYRFLARPLTTQLNSTQRAKIRASMDAGVKTPQCPHLSSHYFISASVFSIFGPLPHSSPFSAPIPLRSTLHSLEYVLLRRLWLQCVTTMTEILTSATSAS